MKFIVAAMLLATGCRHATSPPKAAVPDTYTATRTRDVAAWIVHYRFPTSTSALLFDTQHGSYRTDSWTPLDEGTELVSLSGLDGVFFDPPVSEARFQVRPPDEPPPGTAPFLRFSDGSDAFYTGQLALLTIDSRQSAEALEGSLRAWRGEHRRSRWRPGSWKAEPMPWRR